MTEQDVVGPQDTAVVERSAVLDAAPEAALEALTDPALLSQWLGHWIEGGDGTAVVTTDDGVTRTVDHLQRSADAVRWRWFPDGEETSGSEVTITVVPTGDGRSRLTVREVAGPAPVGTASASAVGTGWRAPAALAGGWAVALLVLQVLVHLRAVAVAVV